MKFLKLATTVTVLVLSASANAAPVEIIYTGSVTSIPSSLNGITSVGDDITITVIADNGGTSLLSQTWSISDTISATVTAGSYNASFIDSWWTSPITTGFETDSTGTLFSTNWFGTDTASLTSTDNFGNGIYLGNGDIIMSNGETMLYSPSLGTVAAWEGPILVSTVPVPAAFWLFGSGLIGLIGVARR